MDVRQTVEQLYRDYASGDLPKIMAVLPERFRFEWESDPDTPPSYARICNTKDELAERLKEIAEKFEFHSYHPKRILVDGDNAAAELQLELTSRITGQRFQARIAHFWSFENGDPVHLVEYMDTALIASQIVPPNVP
jgi:ketosteroid isomerase-like protein